VGNNQVVGSYYILAVGKGYTQLADMHCYNQAAGTQAEGSSQGVVQEGSEYHERFSSQLPLSVFYPDEKSSKTYSSIH
jgi:hypothetical protein